MFFVESFFSINLKHSYIHHHHQFEVFLLLYLVYSLHLVSNKYDLIYCTYDIHFGNHVPLKRKYYTLDVKNVAQILHYIPHKQSQVYQVRLSKITKLFLWQKPLKRAPCLYLAPNGKNHCSAADRRHFLSLSMYPILYLQSVTFWGL